MNERLILVTNDDGYDSKGMEAAIEVARAFGRVVVVAPETTQSGMSQAITMYNPLYLRRIREEEGVAVYAFSGTPVDCVKMAFDYLLRDERVDMVISGVNHGSNSAVNVLYSGTMGAAIEGSFYGCPAVGLSLDNHGADADFAAAVVYGRRIVGDIFAAEVDLVISGINHGSNSAVNVLYSGTMGAAIEGSFYGCPAVGLSLDDHGEDADFEAAVAYGRRIVGSVLENRIELPLCLNVNVPVGSVGELKGMKLCRQNRGFWREEFYRHEDPRGREYFWLTGEFVNGEPEATDTDEWALANKYVAVVPVQVDLTDYRQLKNLTKVLK